MADKSTSKDEGYVEGRPCMYRGGKELKDGEKLDTECIEIGGHQCCNIVVCEGGTLLHGDAFGCGYTPPPFPNISK